MRGSIQEGTHATNESLRRMLWMHNWSNRAPTTGEELKIFESAYIGVRDQSALMFWILRNYDHVHVFLWGFPLSPLSAGQCVTGVFVLWVRNYSYAHTPHICRRWCYCLLGWHSLYLLPGQWLNELVCMFAWGITPIVEFDVQALGVLIVAHVVESVKLFPVSS